MGLDVIIKTRVVKEYKVYADKKCTNIITCYLPEYEEVSYWGKNWIIFDWFDKNIFNNNTENDEHYPINIEILKKLKDNCKKVLENPNLGPELISNRLRDYSDSDYFYSLKHTIEQIEIIEKEIENGANYDLYYYSSW